MNGTWLEGRERYGRSVSGGWEDSFFLKEGEVMTPEILMDVLYYLRDGGSTIVKSVKNEPVTDRYGLIEKWIIVTTTNGDVSPAPSMTFEPQP